MQRVRLTLRRLGRSLSGLIWPRLCPVCDSTLLPDERCLCLQCLVDLPRAAFNKEPFNSLHKRLAAPGLPIDRAIAWFVYDRDSRYSNLIVDSKYHSLPDQTLQAARLMASELMPKGLFDGVDLLLPIPMWSWKELSRGFNQAAVIAGGISDITGLPVGDNLVKIRATGSQTRGDARGRVLNARRMFDLERPGEIEGRHVMLVDDVITTGATMLSALSAIRSAAPTARLSVAALAATSYS